MTVYETKGRYLAAGLRRIAMVPETERRFYPSADRRWGRSTPSRPGRVGSRL